MQERIFKTSDGSLPLVPLAENGPGVLIQKFIYSIGSGNVLFYWKVTTIISIM